MAGPFKFVRLAAQAIPMRRYLPAATVLVALLAASAYWLHWDEKAEERATSQEISNLTNVLAEHVEQTLKRANQLATVLQIQAKKGQAREMIESLMAADAISNNLFVQVAIADRVGNVEVTSIPNASPTNVADREHFRVHETGNA